jgi:hypothetical protein
METRISIFLSWHGIMLHIEVILVKAFVVLGLLRDSSGARRTENPARSEFSPIYHD